MIRGTPTFFDIESTSNFFSIMFLQLNLDIERGENLFDWLNHPDHTWHTFKIYANEIDESSQLREFVHSQKVLETDPKPLFVGYNNHKYDNTLLNRILADDWPYLDERAEQLYKLTEYLITVDRQEWPQAITRNWFYHHSGRPYDSLDLLQILTANQNRPSLKTCGIHMKFPKLQDLPFEPGQALTREQAAKVIDYQKLDVMITAGVYLTIYDDIQFRETLSAQYKLDLYSASDTQIAKTVLQNNIRFDEDEGTYYPNGIHLEWLLPKRFKFHTSTFNKLVDDIRQTIIDESGYVVNRYGTKKTYQLKNGNHREYRYKKHFEFNGTPYIFGVGGMHSDDGQTPGIFEADDETLIVDCDVSSYYPYIFINEELEPKHLKGRFLTPYQGLVETRIQAKRAGKSLEAQRLKIAINSAFGLTNSKFWRLYDPAVFYGITIAGQIYLLDLIEKLAIVGIQTISANTDGIVCIVPRKLKESYDEVCQEWQDRTRFNLEFTQYSKYLRLNVNSYLAITPGGKIKRKKDFEPRLNLDKRTFQYGFKAPIIAVALNEYFINGTEPNWTIGNHDDIYDFCYTQKMKSDFKAIWRSEPTPKPHTDPELLADWRTRTKIGNQTKKSKDAEKILLENNLLDFEETELQRINRYYVSTNGRQLVKKRKSNGSEIRVFAGLKVQILNELVNGDPWLDQYDVDYDFYVNEAMKIINKIENPPPVKKSNKPAVLKLGE